jgi:hypothetical protein
MSRMIVASLLVLMLVLTSCKSRFNADTFGIRLPTYVPTATPGPTFNPTPNSEVYNALSTAAANINVLPDDIAAPGGVALAPAVNGSEFFGYTKGILTAATQQELTGRTIFPLAASLGVWVILIVVMSGTRFFLNVAMFTYKLSVYGFAIIVEIISAIGSFIDKIIGKIF